MWKRTVTGILLVAAMIGLLFLRQVSLLSFDMVILAAIVLCLYELVMLFKQHMTVATVVLIALYAAAIYPVYYFWDGLASVFLISILAFVAVTLLHLFDPKVTMDSVHSLLFMLFYPTLILSLAFDVNNFGVDGGLIGILLIVAVASMTDTFALLVGCTVKGKKLCPTISPKKTISGAIGGLFGGVAAAVIIWAIFREKCEAVFAFPGIPTVVVFILLGLAGAIADQLGDLVASSLKRGYGVKDFGKLFPGHGGLLDRADGILYNTLVVYAFFRIFLMAA